MKKECFVLISVIILLTLASISPVYAEDCEDSQIILRLSLPDNAHGALWDQSTSTYATKICYPFGNYAGENPHQCTGKNLILRLSDITNAHAETPDYPSPNYNVDVCYGDLDCIQQQTCTDGRQAILSLSSLTNAHLSEGTNYPYKICCKPKEEIHWENLKGENITFSDGKPNVNPAAQVRDTIKMIWQNPPFDLSANPEIYFEIYEDDTLTNQNIRTGDNKIPGKIISNNRVEALWTISEADISEGKKTTIPLIYENELDFYFKPIGTFKTDLDDNLLKINADDTPENSNPVAIIIFPENGQVYNVDEPIFFNHSSYDEDDNITVLWDLGDSSTNAADSFMHIYAEEGQKNIVLTVTDSRGKIAKDSGSILVIEPTAEYKEMVFADISLPEFTEYTTETIQFNAKQSYVIKYKTGDKQCIRGSCLSEYVGTPKQIDDLLFDWTIEPGINIAKRGGNAGDEFDLVFMSGEYDVDLNVIFDIETPAIQSSDFVIFQVDVGARCSYEDGIAGWWDGGAFTPSIDDCSGEFRGVIFDCCPEEISECNRETGKCVYSSVSSCKDYSNAPYGEDVCNGESPYNPLIAIADENTKYPTGQQCNDIWQEPGIETNWQRICRCTWDDELPEGEKCKSTSSIINISDGTALPGHCEITASDTTECVGGFKLISWTAQWVGGGLQIGTCESDSAQVPCLSEAMLGFFGISGIMITIIIVFFFYLTKIRKKTRRK